MMGKPQVREAKLFYVGLNLEERVPQDNFYRRIAAGVRFDRVRTLVADCYGNNGHESLDPVVTLKLMLILFLDNLRSERELMKVLPLRLDWLWFLGMDLDSEIPDHSVLSKARRRWGMERFAGLFGDILQQCIDAGLVEGHTAFADSTLLKANADVRSRVPRQLWNQLEQVTEDSAIKPPAAGSAPDDGGPGGTPATSRPLPVALAHEPKGLVLPPAPEGDFNGNWVSATDPDAGTTKRKGRGITLGYRDHTLTDSRCGIVLATVATGAHYDDAALLPVLLDEAQELAGVRIRRVAADSQYGSKANRQRLKRRHVVDYLKPRKGRGQGDLHWLELLPGEMDPGTAIRLFNRRQHVAEGRFAEAHQRMNHRQCRWRGRMKVQIQCYLVGLCQNIKKLAKYGTRGPAKGAGRHRHPLHQCVEPQKNQPTTGR